MHVVGLRSSATSQCASRYRAATLRYARFVHVVIINDAGMYHVASKKTLITSYPSIYTYVLRHACKSPHWPFRSVLFVPTPPGVLLRCVGWKRAQISTQSFFIQVCSVDALLFLSIRYIAFVIGHCRSRPKCGPDCQFYTPHA